MIPLLGKQPDVRAGWFAVAVLVFGGYLTLVAPAERRVRTVAFQAHELYELANRNERLLKNAAGLQAADQRVARDLADLTARKDETTIAVATLGLLRAAEKRHRVFVVSLAPAERSITLERGSENVTLVLRGAYRDVLEAIAELSRGDVLLEIDDVALTQAFGNAGSPLVDATIGATIYDRIEPLMKEKNGVSDDDLLHRSGFGGGGTPAGAAGGG